MNTSLTIIHRIRNRIIPLVVGSAILLLGGCGSGSKPNGTSSDPTASQQNTFRPDTATVQTAQVQPRNFTREIESTGTLVARQHAQLRTLVPGKIIKVNVDIGDYVKKGQILLRIRPRDYQLALEQAEATLARAQAQYNNAKQDYDRIKNLYQAGSATGQQRDQAEAGYQQADASLKQAKAARDDAQQKLEDTIIRAPYSGFITHRYVMEGGFANMGQEAFDITDLSVLEAEMNIPERYAGAIPRGLKVTISFLSNFQPVEGIVSHVNPSIDTSTRTFAIKVRVKNPGFKLPDGLFCTGDFKLPVLKDQPAVPKDALSEQQGQTIVWVIKNGKAHQRQVTKGITEGNWVMIDSGLNIGEKVAVSGTSVLIDGYPVKTQIKSDSGRS